MHVNADERVIFKRDTVLTIMRRLTFPATRYWCNAAYLEEVTPVCNWINHSGCEAELIGIKKNIF